MVKQPFYGGFGLIAVGGLPKPSFNAFKLLHRLGNQRIPVTSNSVLATRRPDGTLVIAVWNLFQPEESGNPKAVTLRLKGLAGRRRVLIHRLDAEHGSLLHAYEAMGKPRYLTQKQTQELRKAAELPPPESRSLTGGRLTLKLPPHCLALIEIR